MKGLAERRLTPRASGAFDAALITDERTQAAKDLAWRKMRDGRVGGMAMYLDRYASPAAMLDALAGKSELAGDLADVLALAFLAVYLPQLVNTRQDIVSAEAESFEADLNGAVRAFAETAPYLMGWRAKSGRRLGGGALSSVMSTYDS